MNGSYTDEQFKTHQEILSTVRSIFAKIGAPVPDGSDDCNIELGLAQYLEPKGSWGRHVLAVHMTRDAAEGDGGTKIIQHFQDALGVFNIEDSGLRSDWRGADARTISIEFARLDTGGKYVLKALQRLDI